MIAAVGIPEFVKGDWIKPGAVVIDVGINVKADLSKKSGKLWVGLPSAPFLAPYEYPLYRSFCSCVCLCVCVVARCAHVWWRGL